MDRSTHSAVGCILNKVYVLYWNEKRHKMGIDKFALFVELHHPSAIMKATKEPRSTQNAYVRAARAGEAVVVDAMTHLHIVSGRMAFKNRAVEQAQGAQRSTSDLEQKNFVTGEELVTSFYAQIVSYFLRFQGATPDAVPLLVLAFDKAQYVNPAKAPLQASRDRGIVGYPPTARLEAGGIRVAPEAPLQSVDVQRLLHSRGLRHALRRYLLNALTDDTLAAPLAWPDNTRLIVDCDDGVFAWRCHPSSGRLIRCDTFGVVTTEENKDWLLDLSSCRNTLGEADLSAVFWTATIMRQLRPLFKPTGVRVISVDTDHAMLQTYHFWKHLHPDTARKDSPVEPYRLVWDNDKNIQLFLSAFVQSLVTLGYARDTLVCVGILSQCDYFKKNLATGEVGHKDIYLGLKNYMAHRRKTGEQGSLGQLKAFRDMLLFVYAQKLKCAPTAEAIQAAKLPVRMKPLLRDAEIMAPYVQFKLTYAYFTHFKCWRVPPQSAEPVAIKGLLDAELEVTRLQNAVKIGA